MVEGIDGGQEGGLPGTVDGPLVGGLGVRALRGGRGKQRLQRPRSLRVKRRQKPLNDGLHVTGEVRGGGDVGVAAFART